MAKAWERSQQAKKAGEGPGTKNESAWMLLFSTTVRLSMNAADWWKLRGLVLLLWQETVHVGNYQTQTLASGKTFDWSCNNLQLYLSTRISLQNLLKTELNYVLPLGKLNNWTLLRYYSRGKSLIINSSKYSVDTLPEYLLPSEQSTTAE